MKHLIFLFSELTNGKKKTILSINTVQTDEQGKYTDKGAFSEPRQV